MEVNNDFDSGNIFVICICVAVLGSCHYFFFPFTQQIFGWNGGRGLKAHLANWRDRQNIPIPIGALGLFIEFFGSFALLVGFLTRPFALGLALFIGIAMLKSHVQHGFFLARRPGEHSGIEYTLALFLMAAALLSAAVAFSRLTGS